MSKAKNERKNPTADWHLSDAPKTERPEDQLSRYQIAEQIASLIKIRTDPECLVIGLYGRWGEGKTTVLNFVETELSTSGDVELVWFNPWGSSGTGDLLTNFYRTIAAKLGEKIDGIANIIESYIERFDTFLSAAGAAFDAGTPGAGLLTKGVLDTGRMFIPKRNVIALKSALEAKIAESGKRILVLVDDIDRVDSEGIGELFSLINVNADLSGVTYLVALDRDLVAKALERKYQGSGDAFLQKLVQLPIHLPPVSKTQLRAFWWTGIEKILAEFKVSEGWTQSELNHFYQTISFVEARLTTPRQATLHWNVFRFAMVKLVGEVNYPDLLAIEWIRIDQPEIYRVIRENPDDFQGRFRLFSKKPKDEHFVELAETENLDSQELKAIRGLLFPSTLDGYRAEDWSSTWYREKFICSTYFFDRYFRYGLGPRDLSENDLFDVLGDNLNDSQWKSTFQKLAKESTAEFLTHLGRRVDSASMKFCSRFLKEVQLIGDYMSDEGHDILSCPSQRAAWIGANCLRRLESEGLQIEDQLREMIRESNRRSIRFLASILRQISDQKGRNWGITEELQEQLLPDIVQRFKEAAEIEVDDWFPFFAQSFKKVSESDWKAWINNFLTNDPSRSVFVIKSAAPKRVPTGAPSDLNRSVVSYLASFLDVNYLRLQLIKDFGDELNVPTTFPLKHDETLSDRDVAEQFLWLIENPESDPDEPE